MDALGSTAASRRASVSLRGAIRWPGGLPPCAAALAYCAVIFAHPLLNDGDTYWHVASGQWMLAHLAVPHADPFSATFAGQPWTAHEWLSELVMALAFRAAGWAGLAILFGAATALAAALLARHLRRFLGLGPSAALLALAAATVAPSLLARPHLLALPVMELWAARLLIARAERRTPSFATLPLMLLWANLHGGFMVGLVLAALLALEAAVEDPATAPRWGLFVAGSAAAALLTPNGVQGFLFPLQMLSMKATAFVVEWQPVNPASLPPVVLIVFGALYLGLVRGMRLPPIRALIVFGLLYAGMAHARNQLLVGVIGLLAVAEPWGRQIRGAERPAGPARSFQLALLGLAAAATLLRLQHPIVRADSPASPVAALAHVPPQLAAQPVFNEYGMGGYLIFSGLRPFIDGRTDLYSYPFFLRYQQATTPDRQALTQVFAQYGIEWTLLDPANPAVALLDHLPGWRRLYADAAAVVHARVQPPAIP